MYANQMINEAEVRKTWAPIIQEATGVKDHGKLTWMSKLCHVQNMNESVYNSVHLNPNMNVPGMGATSLPGNPTSLNGFAGQSKGSGDKAPSLLPLAMQVAAQTIGLDLVPVVPMPGPMGILTYLDFVYAGGKVGNAGGKITNSAPLLIKANLEMASGEDALTANSLVYAAATDANNAAYELTYVGKSRIDGHSIFRVRGNSTATGTTFAQGQEGYQPIYQAVANGVDFYGEAATTTAIGSWIGGPEFVKALEDHIPGFVGTAFESNNPLTGAPNFADFDIDAADPMMREVGESTPDNLMGMNLFNKTVNAKTFQVAAAVTREQVQDLKQFGIDAVAQVEAVLINELTQALNRLILNRIFRMGAENAKNVYAVEGLNLSAFFVASATTTTFDLGPGNTSNTPINFGGQAFQGTLVNAGGETQGSLQRRILTKILAATNLISTRGRRGPATFAVCSGQLGTALQDIAGFVPYPLSNTFNQSGGSLYPIGSLAGVTIYVNPEMPWNDLRVAVGRKGDGNSPGLVFMPYLMAESVETIAEGTMAPKIAVKSRFSIVECGFHPETMYYTLQIKLGDGVSII